MSRAVRCRLVPTLCAVALVAVTACGGAARDESTTAPTGEELLSEVSRQAEGVHQFDQLRAIVVSHEGRVVLEQYYDTDAETYWHVHSVSKSLLSTLVGIALDEGLIDDLDSPLSRLLPRHANAMSPSVAQTTLRHLLTMTAGFPAGDETPTPAFATSRDWVRSILSSQEFPPGGAFEYSNHTSHVLSAVLQEATGVSALDYARSRLLAPLGIDSRTTYQERFSARRTARQLAAFEAAGLAWPRDPQGVSTGWWGLKLRPRDQLRLGQLFLAGGRWEGRQVVPEAWVDQATTQQVATDDSGIGYGFQWWTVNSDGTRSFRAVGDGGQLIVVVPDLELVVVTSTEIRLDDPTSHGIHAELLSNVVDDAIIAQFIAD